MSTAEGGGGRIAAALLLLGSLACVPRLSVQRPALSGSFSGTAAGGEAVVLAFSEGDAAFRGEGSIGGAPVVLAGAVGWQGVGSLVHDDGTTELVELTLSADGERVVLERPGQEPLALERGGTPPPAAEGGPFAGTYRAMRERAPLAEVTLVQRGHLLAGFGVVTGDPVGVSGRVAETGVAVGAVTFADGSQARFQAELSADGASLTVRGFGEPVILRRRGSA